MPGSVTRARREATPRTALAFALVYVVLGFAGRATAVDGETFALVWPAGGVAVLWFLVRGAGALGLDSLLLAVGVLAVNWATGAHAGGQPPAGRHQPAADAARGLAAPALVPTAVGLRRRPGARLAPGVRPLPGGRDPRDGCRRAGGRDGRRGGPRPGRRRGRVAVVRPQPVQRADRDHPRPAARRARHGPRPRPRLLAGAAARPARAGGRAAASRRRSTRWPSSSTTCRSPSRCWPPRRGSRCASRPCWVPPTAMVIGAATVLLTADGPGTLRRGRRTARSAACWPRSTWPRSWSPHWSCRPGATSARR